MCHGRMLVKRKIFTQFDPDSLMDEEKEHRVTSCEVLVPNSQNNPLFLYCIFTKIKSWDFQYDLEVRCQSMEWRTKPSPKKELLAKVEDDSKVDHFL